MPKVALYNTAGEQIGEIELADSIFAVEVNEAAMHQAVLTYLANSLLQKREPKYAVGDENPGARKGRAAPGTVPYVHRSGEAAVSFSGRNRAVTGWPCRKK